MVKIALDPTPFHPDHDLLELPDLVARAGFEHLQLAPHPTWRPSSATPRPTTRSSRPSPSAPPTPGVGITSLLPVQRISWPEEPQRQAAVKNFPPGPADRRRPRRARRQHRVLRPPRTAEDSEAAFHKSMEELLPVLETRGPHAQHRPPPGRLRRGRPGGVADRAGAELLPRGMVYVASHTFHYGTGATTLLPRWATGSGRSTPPTPSTTAGRTVCATSATRRELRAHPPAPAVGDGDVDWTELFDTLRGTGSSTARTRSSCPTCSPRTRRRWRRRGSSSSG